MAGADISFLTSPPHFGQLAYGGSVNFSMTSVRSLHFVHWYSKMGIWVSNEAADGAIPKSQRSETREQRSGERRNALP
jgi:hypothetical protein